MTMITPNFQASVTAPVTPAIQRAKWMLFQPFDFTKWLVMGFCAWLAYLGQGGGSGGGGGFGSKMRSSPRNASRQFHELKDYVLNNLDWLVPLAVGVALVGVLIWLLVMWLSSRGRFMFLHCVIANTAEVVLPWQRFAAQGNSLFLFRIGLGLLTFLVLAPLLLVIGGLVIAMMSQGQARLLLVSGALTAFIAAVGLGVTFAVAFKFTEDFVVPIMFLRRGNCLEGWREFLGLLAVNKANFALYIVFVMVIKIVIAMLILVIVLATCCTAGCLLAIPYVGTVLLLPVLAFERSYSLYYLAQYDAPYDVFAAATAGTGE